ncbi:methyltransferase domain-containing protein [Microbacteriaceae bacterium K1510]|nr:methyltransferase domain-containing protein [Microbacteriaceae bacterium K1510]
MNRKQRRATAKQAPAAPSRTPSATIDPAAQLLATGLRHEQQRQLAEAAAAYQRLLALQPTHAEAANNLGRVLQAQGKAREAATAYAQALRLMPQLLEHYAGVFGTLVALQPALAEALHTTTANWPRRLDIDALFGTQAFAAFAGDPLLQCLLEATPVRDLAFERLLTMLRAALLTQASTDSASDDNTLAFAFACALARQCFINEYIFVAAPEEDAQVAGLKARTPTALSPLQVAALAMYEPLARLEHADTLLAQTWPAPVKAVIAQQIREPAAERALRDTIPRLTEIEDATSARVRAQYEENPYPRWVYPAGQVTPVSLDDYLRAQFPGVAFVTMGKTEDLDILVAGCGTGWHATSVAQTFLGARLLAVDLSLSSLAYAKRGTPARIADRIEYAQADILKLGTLPRRFDVVEVSGVLHHMADLFEGWRILLPLLRQNGLMHVGLYSETARRDVVAARTFIADGGYQATPEDIRRCRQDLMATPLRGLTRFSDFYTTSECRDLLFHTQETRVTIPQIKSFLVDNNLRFLGFEFDIRMQQRLRALFAEQGSPPTDLDRWHALEEAEPDLFSGMYQFWVQRR